MPLFDREISVVIGQPGTSGTLLEGFDVGFEVEKSAEGPPNVGRCELFNLTETTRSKFKAGQDVMIINAGYRESDDGARLCCALDVFDVRVEYNPPDIVTVVAGGDGLHTYKNATLTVSYKGAISVKRIIADVIKQLGLTLQDPAMSSVSDQTFANGFAEAGSVPDLLDRLTGRLAASWSFQNGEIQVAPRNAPASSAVVVLNKRTGLLGRPEKRNKVQSAFVPIVRPGWIIKSLLNPRIEPNGRVRLQSEGVDAVYRVLTVKHTGHTRKQEFFSIADIAEW